MRFRVDRRIDELEARIVELAEIEALVAETRRNAEDAHAYSEVAFKAATQVEQLSERVISIQQSTARVAQEYREYLERLERVEAALESPHARSIGIKLERSGP